MLDSQEATRLILEAYKDLHDDGMRISPIFRRRVERILADYQARILMAGPVSESVAPTRADTSYSITAVPKRVSARRGEKASGQSGTTRVAGAPQATVSDDLTPRQRVAAARERRADGSFMPGPVIHKMR